MATKEKDEVSAPIAILLLFLVFAFAAGGLEGLGGGGDDDDKGNQSNSEDPCDGEDRDHVVRTWFTSQGIVRLRCGDPESQGYRHLRRKNLDDWDKALDCIGRVLGEGEHVTGHPGQESRAVRDIWKLQLAGQRYPTSVIVDVDTGNVLTVFVNSRAWTRCAEGALR